MVKSREYTYQSELKEYIISSPEILTNHLHHGGFVGANHTSEHYFEHVIGDTWGLRSKLVAQSQPITETMKDFGRAHISTNLDIAYPSHPYVGSKKSKKIVNIRARGRR